MAKKISLTPENIKALEFAFDHFFSNGTIFASADIPFSYENLEWNNRKEFTDDLSLNSGFEVKPGDYKRAKQALDKIEGLASKTESESKNLDSNVPEKGLREEQEAERQKRKAELKDSTEQTKKNVETSIKRQQKLAEELRNKNVYVKTQIEKIAQLTKEQQDFIDTLKNAAKADPKKLVNQIEGEVEKKIASSNPQNTTPEEIRVLAKQVAYDTVKNLQGEPLAEEVVIAHALANGDRLVAKTVSDANVSALLQTAAINTANQGILRYTLSRDLAASTFGKEFATEVFGPENLDNFQVVFSDSPQAGFHNYDVSQISQNYLGSLSDQNYFLENIKGFGTGEIKSQFLQQASARLETWIGQLPSDSFLAQTYNTELVQGTLSYFGLSSSAVTWEGTTFFGQIAIENGFGPVLGWLGEKTGIDFGISKVASVLGEEIAGSGLLGEAAGSLAAGEAAGVVTGEVVAGVTTGVTAGATVGSVVPIVGTAIGAVVGWLASKINWKKVKENAPLLVGGVVGVGVGLIAGLTAGIAVGVGAAVLTAGAAGGMAGIASLGSGIAGFFGALASATIAAIGMPILITILTFPVVVALLLFIINSGAYIVPQSSTSYSTGQDNPYFLVTKTANPKKMNNPPGSQTVTYTITITATKGPLTNLEIVSSTCNVIKKDKSTVICPSENIPELSKDLIVSPTIPYSFEFSTIFGSNLSNSLVFDSITISADVAEKTGVSTSGSETVCVGDCPTDCIKVADNAVTWPGNLRANAEAAIASLSGGHPGFVAKVCSKGNDVNLCYNPPQISEGFFAWHVHTVKCDVAFNQKGVGNIKDALFLITHELTHHIQRIDGASTDIYSTSGGFEELNGEGFCTYSATKLFESEAMAEATGLYASIPSWGGCASNYKNLYPRNYIFATSFMK